MKPASTRYLSCGVPNNARGGLSNQKIIPGEWILNEKEKAKIRHKQKVLQERAKQIHKEHKAKVMVNKEVLEAQMKEKTSNNEIEIIKNKNYEKLLVNQDNLALTKEYELKQIEDNRTKDLKEFWNVQHTLKGQRQAEYDRQRGEIGYQLEFSGEDLELKERKKRQQVQLQNNLLQQINDNQHRSKYLDELRRQDELTESYFRKEADKIVKSKDLCKKLEEQSTQKYNEALSRVNKRNADEKRQREDEEVAAHISHLINSTLMTEDPNAARSALGPHRVIIDRWKGMSKEQRDEVHQKLKNQISENMDTKQREIENTRCWANLEASQEEYGLKAAVESELQDRNEQKRIVEENGMLAREQAKRNRDLMMNTNWVSEEFFQNFGGYPR